MKSNILSGIHMETEQRRMKNEYKNADDPRYSNGDLPDFRAYTDWIYTDRSNQNHNNVHPCYCGHIIARAKKRAIPWLCFWSDKLNPNAYLSIGDANPAFNGWYFLRKIDCTYVYRKAGHSDYDPFYV